MKRLITGLALSLATLSSQALELTSPDVKEGELMNSKFEFTGFGCGGDNVSPALSWSDAPEGTKSFAITVYDPDAPTGSGWWHWLALDIPAKVNEVSVGQDMATLGALELVNDYGVAEFGGLCPPEGHGMHRYQFTIWALPTESLGVDASASAALAGYMLNATALESKTITATYAR